MWVLMYQFCSMIWDITSPIPVKNINFLKSTNCIRSMVGNFIGAAEENFFYSLSHFGCKYSFEITYTITFKSIFVLLNHAVRKCWLLTDEMLETIVIFVIYYSRGFNSY